MTEKNCQLLDSLRSLEEIFKGGEYMTKKILLTAVAVTILGGGAFAATNAFAQTPTDQNPVNSLVQEIADKFHLNKNDVQTVFDQHRQEVQAHMESNYVTYLNNLVKNGKITDTQKQLILTKHNELLSQFQSERGNVKNMTPAERKAQFQKTKQDIQFWAQQNNIDPKYLRPFGHGMRFGMGIGMH